MWTLLGNPETGPVSWIALLLAGAVGALLVGMIGFGTSLVVLPTLAILFPTMFAADTALRLATGTTMATMAVGAIAAGLAQSRGKHVSWPLLRVAVLQIGRAHV